MVINLGAVPSASERASAPPTHSHAFSQLLELGKMNDLLSELTSAAEEEERRRRPRPPQLKRNEAAAESDELTAAAAAAEAESAAKSETKMSAAAVEQKSVEGSLKRQNQVG